jgi:dipeptidyl aminopeptidase/acylaminoacyl peptidase
METFTNQNVRLAGTLHKPEGEGPFPALVVLHAASEGLHTDPFYVHLKEKLPQRGIAVFLYDRRGAGQSEGDFETADFATLAEDALAAIAFLRTQKEIDPERIGVYGISQGGWIAPLAAARGPEVAFQVIVSASGVSPAEQMKYGACFHLREAGFGEEAIGAALRLRDLVDDYYRGRAGREAVQVAVEQARRQPWFPYAFLPGVLPEEVTGSKWYYELDYDPLAIWAEVKQPTLFIFPEHDRWVPVEESMHLYQAATAHLGEVSQVRVPGTDHLMGEEKDGEAGQVSKRYLILLLDWLSRSTGSPEKRTGGAGR